MTNPILNQIDGNTLAYMYQQDLNNQELFFCANCFCYLPESQGIENKGLCENCLKTKE